MPDKMSREHLRQIPWESLPIDLCFEKLTADSKGLSADEAARRMEILGENVLPEDKKKNPLLRFLSQFNNALIYVLIGAAALTAYLAHWLDTWVIISVVVINAFIGFLQEEKAQKALDAIRHLLSPQASVVRDHKRMEIPAEHLVHGDIVLLKAGDKVPADMRVIKASHFEVEEASLTGESVAVIKSVDPISEGTVLGERTSMVYTGTTVRAGDMVGIVTATGEDTELGKISTMLSETKAITTPLIRNINRFGKRLSLFIIILSLLVFLYSIFIFGTSFHEAALSVIGLAVAAIPEGLPAIMTITLAIGVQRMAKRNAIIRSLPSVETLGSVTVICSDKTGTLTKNEMTATKIFTRAGTFFVEGSGYEPKGRILLDDKEVDVRGHNILEPLIHAASLCNDAQISLDNNTWVAFGTPTEAALKTLAVKAGFDDLDAERLDDIPFDSKYKYKATLVRMDQKTIIFANGAPEKLLRTCAYQLGASAREPIDPAFWETIIERAAAKGQRLLGSAYLIVDDNMQEITHADLSKDLVFIGVTGIIDPPRPEAIISIEHAKKAGIRVKMITGDHVLTAQSIGQKMGIGENGVVVSGAELENISDEDMRELVKTCDIFARTSPEHKLRLVKALQANGEIVAMTGDGVNDAPALKKADIGVAMGIKGTEVTKDAAAMVLADDNFTSIAAAVEEGRCIYDNLRKTLLFILPTNGAEAFVILAAIVMGAVLPITPVQILWVNMVTAVTLGIALAFEPPESNVMQRPPRDPKASMLGLYFLFRIAFVSFLLGGIILFLFSYTIENGVDEAYARTIAVNTLVAGELFYLLNCRKINQPGFGEGFFSNRVSFIVMGILVAIQLAYTYVPFMNTLFESTPLKAFDWLYPIIGGLFVMLLVEVEKMITRRIWRNKS